MNYTPNILVFRESEAEIERCNLIRQFPVLYPDGPACTGFKEYSISGREGVRAAFSDRPPTALAEIETALEGRRFLVRLLEL